MSWSINIIGHPTKIKARLNEIETTLTGASLSEFQRAKPVLAGACDNVFQPSDKPQPMVRLCASGHGVVSDDPTKAYSNFSMMLEGYYADIVL